MKSHNILGAFFSIAVIWTACRQSDNDCNEWHPDLLAEVVDAIQYSEFVDSIDYIPLETTDECLIGELTDALVIPSYIIVFDQRKQVIWVFNEQGRYSHCLDKHGSGVGEYVNLSQIDFDFKTGTLALLDRWRKSILRYRPNGEFVGKTELEQHAEHFKVNSAGGYLISDAGTAGEKAGIRLVDEQGKSHRRLVTKNTESGFTYNGVNDLLSFGDTIAFIAPNFDNHIYHLVQNEAELLYPFTFYPLPQDSYQSENASHQRLKDFMRTIYLENSKWILTAYWSASYDVRYFLYSKDTGQYRIGRELINDIDGKQWTGHTRFVENNCFLFSCHSDDPEKNPVLQVVHTK